MQNAALAANISFSTYQNILNSELDLHANEDALIAYDAEADFLFESVYTDNASFGGYMVCHTGPNLNGQHRMQRLQKIVDDIIAETSDHDDMVPLNDDDGMVPFNSSDMFDPVYNKADATCALANLPSGVAKQLIGRTNSRLLKGNEMYGHVAVQPMTSYMKMRSGTITHVEEVAENMGVLKYLSVQMCPGSSDMPQIMERVKSRDEFGRSLASRNFVWYGRQERMHEHLRRSLSRHRGMEEVKDMSVQHQRRMDRWDRALAQGIDSDHACAAMFEDLVVGSVSKFGVSRIDFGTGSQGDMSSAASADCILSLIAALSAQPEICGVESAGMPTTMNDYAQWITQSGTNNYRPFWDQGVTGKNVIVQVSDTGLDTDHCHFYDSSSGELKDGTVQSNRRKVVQYVPQPDTDDSDVYDGHGTHVVGSILAKRSTDGTVGGEEAGNLEGMAKDAKVAFFDLGAGNSCCFVPGDTATLFGPGVDAGAKFHSASWGNSDSSYSFYSSIFDQFAYDNDDFLSIVAAGNSGTSLNSVGSPATAKNIIAVGASQSEGRDLYSGNEGMDYLAYFSSRGPTNDGRMKPDLVAPGHAILSSGARPSQVNECEGPSGSFPSAGGSSTYGIAYMSGTSMATPVTTGNAALVRQYFMDGYYPSGSANSANAMSNPSASLIKAVLINGAQSLLGSSSSWNGGFLPVTDYDNNIGFGRVNLITSLPLSGENSIIAEIHDRVPISNGQFVEYEFDSSQCESTNGVSATIVWTDPPNSSGCSNCVLNDLDLKMEVGSDTYYPNGLSSADSTNNSERIRQTVADDALVKITVTASNLVTSSQNYAISILGCLEGKSKL